MHSLTKNLNIMFYKFEYNYERCQSCVVEADSLEEALKIANDEGDWEDIDWQECNKQGLSSKVLQVCEDWNRTQDYDYVAQKYKLAIPTIRSYIQHGIEIGLCNTEYYCDISERISVCSQEAQAKPVYSITDDIYFFSSHTAEEYYKKQGLVYQAGSILRAAREEKEYKGRRFEIITKQEFNEYFLDSNKITIGKLFNEKYFNLQNHKLKSA